MRYLRFLLFPLLCVACMETDTPLTDPGDAPLFMAAAGGDNAAYAVGFTSFVIHDATRDDRPIPIYVWYPADPAGIDENTPEAVYPLDPFFGALPDATSSDFEQYGLEGAYQEPIPASNGAFPLVMFSPGWGAAAYVHMDVGTNLAKHGFVVAAVTHYGDGTVFNPAEPDDPLAVASYNRPRDVSAALDAVLAMDLLNGAIDQSMIVASGWSLGGYASMVLAAGDDSVCDLVPFGDIPPWTCAPSFPDPRIRMIIPLDGSNQLLHFQELARMTLPAMGMGQEWSTVGSWQARQHAAFMGHPRYRVDVNRSIHQSFSTLCETVQVWGDYGILPAPVVESVLAARCNPDIIASAEAHRLVAKYMLAMLTHQQNILTPGHAITSEPDIEFFVTEKRNPHSIDVEWPSVFTYHMHQPGRATSNAGENLTATAETDPTGRPVVEWVGVPWR
jgi:hypothetical protein